jgi:cytochrome c oxidase subunit 3
MANVMTAGSQKNKIHPHKFSLWIGIGSIIMMFAGLTSAFVVRQAQGNWVHYKLPQIFWISTLVIIFSSVTMHLGLRFFKQHKAQAYRIMIWITAVLGVVFVYTQYEGFKQLYEMGIRLQGNPSGSFLFIIAGLHGVHVLGGVLAIFTLLFSAYRKRVKNYNSVPTELVVTYWHFVDVLWVYLFIFFMFSL